MRKKLFLTMLCFFVLTTTTLITASADTGPKPSVVIDFKGLEQKNCYVTLLSKSGSTGPYTAFTVSPYSARYKVGDADYEIWEKFESYQDKDGFYFLQYFSKLDDSAVYAWGYFPPQEFKILMYFPDDNSFVVSDGIYQRYAFDSYYSVDASGLGAHPGTGGETVRAMKNYDYRQELVSLVVRIVLTIAIELLIALPFGFRAKKQLLIIGLTNVVTQTILNILLNIINYSQGPMIFVFNYIWMEIAVFAFEAWIYNSALRDDSEEEAAKKPHPVAYAFIANAASFIAGLVIAHIIPGIF